MVAGLDTHKKQTVGFVVHGDVASGDYFTVPTTNEGLRSILPRLEGHKVVIEASTTGKAVARFLRNHGADVDLVQADVLTGHVRYVKTDTLDARDLARIGLVGGYNTCYIPTPDEDEIRCLVRHIRDTREQTTRIKNQAKAILQRNLVPEPPGNLENEKTRTRWMRLALPESERAALSGKLAMLERAVREEDDAMLQLCELVNKNSTVHARLTLPGVDTYTAATVAGFCGDMTRFSNAKKISSFAGLVPRLYQSGQVARHGRITKRGPNVLRFALIEAAHNVVHSPGRLANKYARLARRVGKGRAIVAVARNLATIMWNMLVNHEPYRDQVEPLSAAKTWRLTTVARLSTTGKHARAVRLLRTADLKRAHSAWKRGTSKLVPTT